MKKENMYKDVKTWNPFLGCNYNCVYCGPTFRLSVWRTYNRQGKTCKACRDFLPHEHPNRLSNNLPGNKIIWPCSHGDLTFARPEYIKKVIQVTKKHPERTYYFQSKNPACFKQYLPFLDPPLKTILLTTLETNRDEGYRAISKAPLPSVRYKDFLALDWPLKIVTIEPVLDFDPPIFLKWIDKIDPISVWIGFNSHPKLQLPEPSKEKVLQFIKDLRKLGIEVKQKTMR